MALVQPQTGGSKHCLFDTQATRDPLPPAGTYKGRIVDCVDKFGVTRPKFDNPSETETVDLTQYRIEYRAKGKPYTIDTRPMKISGNEKSALVAFFVGVLGAAPKLPFDGATLVGREVIVTVTHEEGKSMTWAKLANVSPCIQDEEEAQPAPRTATLPAKRETLVKRETLGDDGIPF